MSESFVHCSSEDNTSFTDLLNDGKEDEGDVEDREMKFVPPVIKSEPSEDPVNVTAEDEADDAFIKGYLSDDSDQGQDKGSKTKKTRRGGNRSVSGRSGKSKIKDNISATEGPKTGRKRMEVRKNQKITSTNSVDWCESGDNASNDDGKDGNYSPSEDDEDWGGPTQKKKKKRSSAQKNLARKHPSVPPPGGTKRVVSDATREKDRIRKQQSRQRKRLEKGLEVLVKNANEVKKKSTTEEKQVGATKAIRLKEESENEENVEKINKTAKKLRGGGKSRKKKISEMTPEEAEKVRAQWREQRKNRRAKDKALVETYKSGTSSEPTHSSTIKNETDSTETSSVKVEQEQKMKTAERRRLQRAMAKQGMLPEEQLRRIELQKEKDRERKRIRRATLTPEQKREESMRHTMYRIARQARMTDEEKQSHKIDNFMQYSARMSVLSPEERERRKLLARVRGRRRYEKLKATLGEEGIRERQRNYRRQMSEVQKAKEKEKLKEYYRKKMEKLKQDPEKWEEVKQQWRDREKLYIDKRREHRKGKRGVIRQLCGDTFKNKSMAELTEEEHGRVREIGKNYRVKRKLAIQKLLDGGMTMEEIKQQSETPAQRERRLIRGRIRRAKQTVRVRLEKLGASQEEIEQQIEEVKHTYQPTLDFRPYKPRLGCWRPVDPNDVAKLEREGKLANLDQIKPLRIFQKQIGSETAAPITPSKSTVSPRGSTTMNQSKPMFTSQEDGHIHHHQIQPSVPMAPTSSSYSLFGTQPQYSQTPGSSQVYYHNQQHQVSQSQPYTFQNILDGLVPCSSQQASYHHTHYHDNSTTTASSHPEYGSSYCDDDYNDNHSPPSGGGADYGNNNDSNSTSFPLPLHKQEETAVNQTTKPTTKSTKKRVRGPPKSGKVRKRKYVYQPPKNPNAILRTKRADVVRDVICEECGEAFNKVSIIAHKRQRHNPNYDVKNRKCLICGETYRLGYNWYRHYVQDHVKPPPASEKSQICEECGMGFKSLLNYKKHMYFMHGDGLKKENHFKCPVCLNERLFKERGSLDYHIKRVHPFYVQGGHDCFHCDKSFRTEKALGEHVESEHPGKGFRCQFCQTIRFTQLGLNFHYRRCIKTSNEKRNELKKIATEEGKIFCLEDVFLPCEFCEKKITVSSLTRHFKEVHNVNEDNFTCSLCQKVFKRRGFWCAHLEEKHQKSVDDEFFDMVRKLNASNREGLCVKPIVKGVKNRRGGGGRKPSKKAGDESVKKQFSGRKRHNSRSSEDENNNSSEEEEDNGWISSYSNNNDHIKHQKIIKTKKVVTKTKHPKKPRNVVVIAEEDEVEEKLFSSGEKTNSELMTDLMMEMF